MFKKSYKLKPINVNIALNFQNKRLVIYRLDIYNLQIKTISFSVQEKLYKEVVFRLAFSMNADTKNSQIKHCLCPKQVVV